MTREEAAIILKHEIFKFAQSRDMQEDSTKYRDAVKIAIDALHAQQSTTKLDRSQWEECKSEEEIRRNIND